MYNRIIHFEIHATDTDRLAEFYRQLFGWEIKRWDNPSMDYLMVMTAPEGNAEPGINGGITKRQGQAPEVGQAVTSYVCTVAVPSVDEYLKKIEQLGGKVALPKMPIPGMAWLAYGLDIDNNIFGIFEEDAKAK